MTVQELQAALQAAIDNGLPPTTTVVVEEGGWYKIINFTEDPSQNPDYDMWFTLFTGEEADSRFTEGGMP